MPYSESQQPNFDLHNFGTADTDRVFNATHQMLVQPIKMRPYTPREIDPGGCVNIDEATGLPVTTAIHTADLLHVSQDTNSFVVLDVRRAALDTTGRKALGNRSFHPGTAFLLVGRNFDGNTGVRGIGQGETLRIGRSNPDIAAEFALTNSTSREHFTLSYTEEGELVVTDQGSSNGTHAVRGFVPSEPIDFSKLRFEHPEAGEPSMIDPEEAAALGLGSKTESEVDRLYREFQDKIPNSNIGAAALAGLVYDARNLRALGLDDDAVIRKLRTRAHPDKGRSDVQSFDREILFQAVDFIVQRMQRR